MENRKGNRPATKGKGSEKPKTSTPLRDLTSATDNNVSIISNVSSIANRPASNHRNAQNKNQNEGAHSNESMSDLKCLIYQRNLLFCQQRESLQDLNKQIEDLREKLEKGKKEANAVINGLKEISCIEQRHCLEKKLENVLVDPDEQKVLPLLMETVDQRGKLVLDNIDFMFDDEFKTFLSEAESTLKAFNEGKDLESIQNLASFLPKLDGSLQMCHESNQKCAVIMESLKKILLHQKILTSPVNNV